MIIKYLLTRVTMIVMKYQEDNETSQSIETTFSGVLMIVGIVTLIAVVIIWLNSIFIKPNA